jgi:hypothetical protein
MMTVELDIGLLRVRAAVRTDIPASFNRNRAAPIRREFSPIVQ